MYVMLLDRLEREALTEQQMYATWVAVRGEQVECLTFAERQAELDELLLAPLEGAKPADRKQADLMRALGMTA